MQTFTVGFGSEDCELQGAAETAREIQSQHHALELTASDLARDLERIARHLDEQSAIPQLSLSCGFVNSRAPRQSPPLGEGADELFAV